MKFGTDGVRGPANASPIDVAGAVAIGRSAARWARELGSPRVVIARDTRESGRMLAYGVLAGIASEGAIAIDGGVMPTAGVAIALENDEAPVGVMITASHNPWTDNGFKVLGPAGRKPSPDEVQALEEWASAPPRGGRVGEIQAMPALATAWADRLAERVAWARLAGRQFVVDLAEGAATIGRARLQQLAEIHGFQIEFIDGDRINDAVGSEHPGRLAQRVRDVGADGGIAVDGDADRCVLVDERGEIVPGDGLAWLLATSMQVDALAVTVMSNGALGPALPGVQLTVTPVGDKHLQAAMRTSNIRLGCEESGHVLFADHPGGDGLLAGFRAMAAVTDGSLSAALSGFVPWPRRLSKIRVSARPPLETLTPLMDAKARGEVTLGDGGRVFLRYSGTEPVLRILVEGRDRTAVDRVAADVEATARALP